MTRWRDGVRYLHLTLQERKQAFLARKGYGSLDSVGFVTCGTGLGLVALDGVLITEGALAL